MKDQIEKEQVNKIVKYHNDLSDVCFENFKASDLDIFMSICMKCANQGKRSVVISDTELARLSHYGKDLNRMRRDIEDLQEKLTNMKIRIESRQLSGRITLFPTFIRDKERKESIVKVNEDFLYILNEFQNGNFTEFELEEFVTLKSVYSRLAYRQLKRFKDTGVWIVGIDHFRELLDIPKTYRMDNISQRVLIPVRKELSEYFEDLKIEKITERGEGKKGRPGVIALKFTFKKKAHRRKLKKVPQRCPYCGDCLYEKQNARGQVFFAHKEDRSAESGCRRTFGSIDEIRTAAERGSSDSGGEKEKTLIKGVPDDVKETIDKWLKDMQA